MNEYELKVLTILFLTNKTLYEARSSNQYRLDAIDTLTDDYREKMVNISIVPLDKRLDEIRNEIYNILILSHEYLDFLSNYQQINIYDVAEIIVEIGDINRFKNCKHFISYAGLAPVDKKNDKVYKVSKYKKGTHVANKKYDNIDYCENLKVCLTKCTQKIIKSNVNNEYKTLYNEKTTYYHLKHPTYSKKRVHYMALKKATVKFAKEIYNNFSAIKEIEEYEQVIDTLDNNIQKGD